MAAPAPVAKMAAGAPPRSNRSCNRLCLEGRASTHQSDARYGRYAGSQCVSNCAMYLISSFFNRGKPIVSRDQLDDVLRRGAKCDYLLRHGGHLREDQHAQLSHVPSQISAPEWGTCFVYQSAEHFGYLGIDSDLSTAEVRPLRKVLAGHTRGPTQYFLFITRGKAQAVILTEGKLYMFDPHCMPGEPGGPAYVATFQDADALVAHVGDMNDMYTGSFLYFVPEQEQAARSASFYIGDVYRIFSYEQPSGLRIDLTQAPGGLGDVTAFSATSAARAAASPPAPVGSVTTRPSLPNARDPKPSKTDPEVFLTKPSAPIIAPPSAPRVVQPVSENTEKLSKEAMKQALAIAREEKTRQPRRMNFVTLSPANPTIQSQTGPPQPNIQPPTQPPIQPQPRPYIQPPTPPNTHLHAQPNIQPPTRHPSPSQPTTRLKSPPAQLQSPAKSTSARMPELPTGKPDFKFDQSPGAARLAAATEIIPSASAAYGATKTAAEAVPTYHTAGTQTPVIPFIRKTDPDDPGILPPTHVPNSLTHMLVREMAQGGRKRQRSSDDEDPLEDDDGGQGHQGGGTSTHQSKQRYNKDGGDEDVEDIWMDDDMPRPTRERAQWGEEDRVLDHPIDTDSMSEDTFEDALGADPNAGEDKTDDEDDVIEVYEDCEEGDMSAHHGAAPSEMHRLEFTTSIDSEVSFARLDELAVRARQYSLHAPGTPRVWDPALRRGVLEATAIHDIDKALTSLVLELGLVSGREDRASGAKNLLRLLMIWGEKLSLPTTDLDVLLMADLCVPYVYMALRSGMIRQPALAEHVANKLRTCLVALHRGDVEKEALQRVTSLLTAELQRAPSAERLVDPREALASLSQALGPQFMAICTTEEADAVTQLAHSVRQAIEARNAEIREEDAYFERLLVAMENYQPHPEPPDRPIESRPHEKLATLIERLTPVEADITVRVHSLTADFLAAFQQDMSGNAVPAYATMPSFDGVVRDIATTIQTLQFCIAILQLPQAADALKLPLQQLMYMGGEVSASAGIAWPHAATPPVTELNGLGTMRALAESLRQQRNNELEVTRILDLVERTVSTVQARACSPPTIPGGSQPTDPAAVAGVTSGAAPPNAADSTAPPGATDAATPAAAQAPQGTPADGASGGGNDPPIATSIQALMGYMANAGTLLGGATDQRYKRLQEAIQTLANSEEYLLSLLKITTFHSLPQTLGNIAGALRQSAYLQNSTAVQTAVAALAASVTKDVLAALAKRDLSSLTPSLLAAFQTFASLTPQPASDTAAAALSSSMANLMRQLEAVTHDDVAAWSRLLDEVAAFKSSLATSEATGAVKRAMYNLAHKLSKDMTAGRATAEEIQWDKRVATATPTSLEEAETLLRDAPNEKARKRAETQLAPLLKKLATHGPAPMDTSLPSGAASADALVAETTRLRGEEAWARIQAAFTTLRFEPLGADDWTALATEYMRAGSAMPMKVGPELVKMVEAIAGEIRKLLDARLLSLLPGGPPFTPPNIDWIGQFQSRANFYLRTVTLPRVSAAAEAAHTLMMHLQQAIGATDLRQATVNSPLEGPAATFDELYRALEAAATDHVMDVTSKVDDYVEALRRHRNEPNSETGKSGTLLTAPPGPALGQVPKTYMPPEATTTAATLPELMRASLLAHDAALVERTRSRFEMSKNLMAAAEKEFHMTREEAAARLSEAVTHELRHAPTAIAGREVSTTDPFKFFEDAARDPALVSRPTYKDSLDYLSWVETTAKSIMLAARPVPQTRFSALIDEISRRRAELRHLSQLEDEANAAQDPATLAAAIQSLDHNRVVGGKETIKAWTARRQKLEDMLQTIECASETLARFDYIAGMSRNTLLPHLLRQQQNEALQLVDTCKDNKMNVTDPELTKRVHELTHYLKFKHAFLDHYLSSNAALFNSLPLHQDIPLLWPTNISGSGETGARLATRLVLLGVLRNSATSAGPWVEVQPHVDETRPTLVPTNGHAPLHMQPVFDNVLETQMLSFSREFHSDGRPLPGTLNARLGVEVVAMLGKQWTNITKHSQEVLQAYEQSILPSSGSDSGREFTAMVLLAQLSHLASSDIKRPASRVPVTEQTVKPRQWLEIMLSMWPQVIAGVMAQSSFKDALEALRIVYAHLHDKICHLTLENKYGPGTLAPSPRLPEPNALLFFQDRWTVTQLDTYLWGDPLFSQLNRLDKKRARISLLLWGLHVLNPVVVSQLWASTRPLSSHLSSPRDLLSALVETEVCGNIPNAVPLTTNEAKEPPYEYGIPTGTTYQLQGRGGLSKEPPGVTAFEAAMGAILMNVKLQLYYESDDAVIVSFEHGLASLLTPLLDCTGETEPFRSLALTPRQKVHEAIGDIGITSTYEEIAVFTRQCMWLDGELQVQKNASLDDAKQATLIVTVNRHNYVQSAYLPPRGGFNDQPEFTMVFDKSEKWAAEETLTANIDICMNPSEEEMMSVYRSLARQAGDKLTPIEVFSRFPQHLRRPKSRASACSGGSGRKPTAPVAPMAPTGTVSPTQRRPKSRPGKGKERDRGAASPTSPTSGPLRPTPIPAAAQLARPRPLRPPTPRDDSSLDAEDKSVTSPRLRSPERWRGPEAPSPTGARHPAYRHGAAGEHYRRDRLEHYASARVVYPPAGLSDPDDTTSTSSASLSSKRERTLPVPRGRLGELDFPKATVKSAAPETYIPLPTEPGPELPLVQRKGNRENKDKDRPGTPKHEQKDVTENKEANENKNTERRQLDLESPTSPTNDATFLQRISTPELLKQSMELMNATDPLAPHSSQYKGWDAALSQMLPSARADETRRSTPSISQPRWSPAPVPQYTKLMSPSRPETQRDQLPSSRQSPGRVAVTYPKAAPPELLEEKPHGAWTTTPPMARHGPERATVSYPSAKPPERHTAQPRKRHEPERFTETTPATVSYDNAPAVSEMNWDERGSRAQPPQAPSGTSSPRSWWQAERVAPARTPSSASYAKSNSSSRGERHAKARDSPLHSPARAIMTMAEEEQARQREAANMLKQQLDDALRHSLDNEREMELDRGRNLPLPREWGDDYAKIREQEQMLERERLWALEQEQLLARRIAEEREKDLERKRARELQIQRELALERERELERERAAKGAALDNDAGGHDNKMKQFEEWLTEKRNEYLTGELPDKKQAQLPSDGERAPRPTPKDERGGVDHVRDLERARDEARRRAALDAIYRAASAARHSPASTVAPKSAAPPSRPPALSTENTEFVALPPTQSRMSRVPIRGPTAAGSVRYPAARPSEAAYTGRDSASAVSHMSVSEEGYGSERRSGPASVIYPNTPSSQAMSLAETAADDYRHWDLHKRADWLPELLQDMRLSESDIGHSLLEDRSSAKQQIRDEAAESLSIASREQPWEWDWTRYRRSSVTENDSGEDEEEKYRDDNYQYRVREDEIGESGGEGEGESESDGGSDDESCSEGAEGEYSDDRDDDDDDDDDDREDDDGDEDVYEDCLNDNDLDDNRDRSGDDSAPARDDTNSLESAAFPESVPPPRPPETQPPPKKQKDKSHKKRSRGPRRNKKPLEHEFLTIEKIAQDKSVLLNPRPLATPLSDNLDSISLESFATGNEEVEAGRDTMLRFIRRLKTRVATTTHTMLHTVNRIKTMYL
ncbi:Large tegument protein [Eptesicus fuscus gammaherpesvirus]|uniref:Large tegument protein n=1 Tax=vespertilionid gammaherpesvirus 3 TaxID=2846598 RepID=A0A2D1AFD9_9GAMA|nr:Large tegument protein [Eptesicus fuscus gammaherpesvirus]ATA58295.1 Large tegument protein [Eptesicus fuscus gammaherpesvirus]